MQPIITASHIAKSYNNTPVLRDINLQVYAGEFLTIIGPSGNGKSTLLQILGCIDKFDHGNLTIFNQNITHLSDKTAAHLRNTTFGFIFQFFHTEPHLTIARNLEIPLMPRHLNYHSRIAKVKEVANLVNITDKLNQKPHQLSGGQLQRAAIARAIINQPKVILADEPTGNLDTNNTLNIMNLLLRIKQQQGTTLIMVTHDLSIARQADRVLKLENGELSYVKL